ncbi:MULTISPECIES: hypothetical protein [Enterobacteriaceae]|jgi:hypothetical protein|uniref:Uncharacterized protein n=1 Tax=Intestinirhabdus alba TaxID=2899544 RepID=A0A6L6IRA1_9ENTR|nr:MULTISPECIES: hypothetical protein [Enterobacteriaceae]EHM4904064.1 hypothetical protein [Salmonella enterica]MTH47540.1 hypothetical protein [Intestinirhabdus alba]
MTLSDIRVFRAELSRISAWLNITEASGTLPGYRNAACLWLTLCGNRIVMSKALQQGTQVRIIVLYQTGKATPPQTVWPVLAHFYATTPADAPEINLILTGNDSQIQHQAWTQYLALSTPDSPPAGRLLLRFVLCCLAPVAAGRAAHIVRRLLRRGRASA